MAAYSWAACRPCRQALFSRDSRWKGRGRVRACVPLVKSEQLMCQKLELDRSFRQLYAVQREKR